MLWMGVRLKGAFCAVALLLLLAPVSAWAAEGSLDQSFGEAGWASAAPGTLEGPTGSAEIGVGPDGSADVADGGASIVRFTAAGARHYGFGEGGVLSFRVDPAAEGVAARHLAISSIAVDGDGRLLAFGAETDSRHIFEPEFVSGGSLPQSLAMVLRYDPEGRLDPTFGGGRGFVTGTFGFGSPKKLPLAEAMKGAVDSRDRPVFLAGAVGIGSSCIAHAGVTYLPRGIVRLTEAGEPDPSFGDGGTVRLESTEISPVLGLDAAGGPVTELGPLGNAEQVCRPTTRLVRLSADGSRRGFGKRAAIRLKEQWLALVEPSGALLIEGFRGRQRELARILPTGARDKGFGRAGLARVRLPRGMAFGVRPVAVDAAGRILLVGYSGTHHGTVVVGRLLANGRLDPSFGEGGWIVTPVPDHFAVGSTAASLDPQGRLLVAAAGTGAPADAGNGYLLARFLLGPNT